MLQSIGNYYVLCFGLLSCAFVDKIYNYDGQVECMGELSCINSNIYMGDTGGQEIVHIQGDWACKGSLISGAYYNFAFSNFDAKMALL